jgi:multiple sugar transport system ATP-binding protein
MAGIVCKGLSKTYEGGAQVLENFDLEVAEGELLVLLGPSGCGKSTLLRMVAGLEEISGGELSIGGRRVNEVEPGERNVAMVFQNYALYPHMTVYDNIAFGLRRQRLPQAEVDRRVREVAALLGLEPLLERKPRAMSGGQQQRAAIARAMSKTPEVFLFDEPLSNLDAKLRAQLRSDIKRLHQRLKTTSLYVTHDQLEAMTLADRIVLMRGGHIEQVGTPREIYAAPRTRFVAGFIGTPAMNFVELAVRRQGGAVQLAGPGFARAVDARRYPALADGQQVVLGIRPNHLRLAAAGQGERDFAGTVTLVELLGAEAQVSVACEAGELAALVPAERMPAVGEAVALAFDDACVHLFDAADGLNLASPAAADGQGAGAPAAARARALAG